MLRIGLVLCVALVGAVMSLALDAATQSVESASHPFSNRCSDGDERHLAQRPATTGQDTTQDRGPRRWVLFIEPDCALCRESHRAARQALGRERNAGDWPDLRRFDTIDATLLGSAGMSLTDGLEDLPVLVEFSRGQEVRRLTRPHSPQTIVDWATDTAEREPSGHGAPEATCI